MKVLHVSDTSKATVGRRGYDLFQGCDAEALERRYLFDLCRDLPARGHRVVLVHGQPAPGETDGRLASTAGANLPAEVRTCCVPELGCATAHGRMWAAARLLQLIREESPDVVHLHHCRDPFLMVTLTRLVPTVRYLHDCRSLCPTGLNIDSSTGRSCERTDLNSCRLWCVAHASYVRGIGPKSPGRLIRRFRRRFQWLSAHRQTAHLMVPSDFMREALLRRGFPAGLVAVNPYYVRLPGRPLPVSTGEARVLFGGRIDGTGGLDHLLRALAGLNGREQFVLDVVGDGPARAKTERLARRLKLSARTRFLGRLSPELLETTVRRARVVVMPRPYPEVFGLDGIEMMARTRPVIAYDCGAADEWLRHGRTGFLVPVGDIDRLGNRVVSLLQNPLEAARLGLSGYERVKSEYSVSRHLTTLETVYHRAMVWWRRSRGHRDAETASDSTGVSASTRRSA